MAGRVTVQVSAAAGRYFADWANLGGDLREAEIDRSVFFRDRSTG